MASTNRTRKCLTAQCEEIISTSMLFCHEHWTYVPVALQQEIMREYTAGTLDTPNLTSKKIRHYVQVARRTVNKRVADENR